MDPYETDISKVPSTDQFVDLPLYGRYKATPEEFKVNEERGQEDIEYWESVLAKCSEDNKILNVPGKQDIFAVGNVIVRSSHIQDPKYHPIDDRRVRDLNEIDALEIVKQHFPKIPIPKVYFHGTVCVSLFYPQERNLVVLNSHNKQLQGYTVLIQERIEGVTLDVAWQYITGQRKYAYRRIIRNIIKAMYAHSDSGQYPLPSYVVACPVNRGVSREELEILHKWDSTDGSPGFAHNNMKQSNIIVKDGKIMGIIGWGMAGFFGKESTELVHRRFRHEYLHLHAPQWKLDKKQKSDLLYWYEL